MNNKATINEMNMDYQTYKKISGTLSPKDKSSVTITGDRPNTNSNGSTNTNSNTTSTTSITTEEETIEPKDKETIKYLSNIKDSTTGEVSKPFTIRGKNYQMVRGTNTSGEVVVGVYCHDDIDADGVNIIHPTEYFEKNIASPMKENEIDFAGEETNFNDKEDLMNYLNLVGLEGYNHFFVNVNTGDIVAKFKNTKEMATSGVKLGQGEDYMDAKALKRFRFGDYFKNDISEGDLSPEDSGTNIPKLKADVKKLANLIKTKFSIYLSKLNKPIEQAQFLTAMANEIGVPLSKLSSIISTYKDIADNRPAMSSNASPQAESRVITKKKLDEKINGKVIIKKVKIKDIK